MIFSFFQSKKKSGSSQTLSRRRRKLLSAGGKLSTMVTAGKTCKAGHFEKQIICRNFVIRFIICGFSHRIYFFGDFIFHLPNLSATIKTKSLFNVSIVTNSWSTETPFRLEISGHMWEEIFFMLQNLRKRPCAMEHRRRYTCDVNHLFSYFVEKMFLFQIHIFTFFIQKLCNHFLKTSGTNTIENGKLYSGMSLQMIVTFHNFHQKWKNKFSFSHMFDRKTFQKAFRHYHEDVVSYFKWKKKFSFFFIFDDFSSFFNCRCHSTSRHTDFKCTWTFWNHYSASLLSNFSRNDFIFSCECWFVLNTWTFSRQ